MNRFFGHPLQSLSNNPKFWTFYKGRYRGNKPLLAAIGALLLLPSLVLSAQAAHPTQICLDVRPDREGAISNDGDAEELEAAVGATDADHEEPHEEGCVIGEGGGQTQVDFEITGVSDPDESDTPETPDMSCTTRDGTAFCTVIPPSAAGGEQTIAAWIDFDRDDSTVELDRDEEVDDEDTDATDVALWTWTHGDPCEASSCIEISISYERPKRAFVGRVFATDRACISGREVILKKIRNGKRVALGSTLSSRRGSWLIALPRARGKFYAIAKRIQRGDSTCSGLSSVTIRVR